jgi:molybdopterin-synthase adenylyltransferase
MKRKLYIEKSVLDVFISSDVDCVQAIAFEIKNEGVFRAYYHYPEINPVGIPIPLLFLKVGDFNELDFDNLPKPLFQGWGTHKLVLTEGNNNLFKVYLIDSHSKLIDTFELEVIPDGKEIYSRNKGLLETDLLKNKKVLIIGLGSFGSQIAVDLAKSGVGNFTLIDYDILEAPNIARHVCDLRDLGRFKTKAIKDHIKARNPEANVKTFEKSVFDNPLLIQEEMTDSDVVICATDNNPSRELICSLAYYLEKTVLYGRAFTRAYGGDVFRQKKGGPCYSCLIDLLKNTAEEVSNLKQSQALSPAYVSLVDVNSNIQVGLAVDIQPFCNLMSKLTLLELGRNFEENHLKSLDDELSFDFYLWLNRPDRKSLYQTSPFNKPIIQGQNPLKILNWVGIHVKQDSNCQNCNSLLL